MAKNIKSKLTKAKTEKAEKAKKGERYYCTVCGCEIACIQPGTEAIVCCDEPMLLVCE